MRLFKTTFIVLSAVAILLLLLIALWVIWEHKRNPLSAVDIEAGRVVLQQDSVIVPENISLERTYRRIVLATEELGEITFSLSLPMEIPVTGLPLIIVLGGLEIGEANFELIDEPGENIIAIYHYPYSPQYWYKGSAAGKIPLIRRSMLRVPAQVANLIKWAAPLDQVDSERVCITGYSFGAMFLPAVYRLAESRQLLLQQGVIAYAGTGIYDLLAYNLGELPRPFRSLLAWLAATAIHTLEPALHLPHLHNEFLLINGIRDHQIPEHSWRRLHQLTPDPKTTVILDEGHMHPDKPALTRKLVEISRRWLLDNEVINP